MKKITYEQVSIKSDSPSYSPYGYIILEDGTIYSLIEKCTHGVLLAILFPNVAREKGFDPPDEDYCIFHYQGFELDNQDILPVIRVSISYLNGMLNISKGKNPITPLQKGALCKVVEKQGIFMNTRVSTEEGIMTVSSYFKHLSTEVTVL